MQNSLGTFSILLSLGYMLRVLLAVSANFPDNPHNFKSIFQKTAKKSPEN